MGDGRPTDRFCFTDAYRNKRFATPGQVQKDDNSYGQRLNMLRWVLDQKDGHWGFLIVRTTYGPGTDEDFIKALTAIEQSLLQDLLGKNYHFEHEDRLILAHYIHSRFQNTILENEDLLADADEEILERVVGEFFAREEIPEWGSVEHYLHYLRRYLVFSQDVIDNIINAEKAGNVEIEIGWSGDEFTDREEVEIKWLWSHWMEQSEYS